MIALRVADVEDLNTRARARLLAVGELTGPALTTPSGRKFQAGDRIVCLRNNRRLGVVNGTRATVTAVDPGSKTLTVRLDDQQRSVRLPADYLDAGHVTHGYAVTGHKAQGMTTSHTWVLGSEALYREWGYVALSRGRQRNRLYVVAGEEQAEQVDSHGAHQRPADPIAALAGVLGRSRTQHMATPESTEPGSPAPPGNSCKVEVSPHVDSGSVVALQRERERAVRRVAALREQLATATPEQRASSVVRRLVKRTSASFPAAGPHYSKAT